MVDRARFELLSAEFKTWLMNFVTECGSVDNNPETIAEIEAFFEEFVKAYPKDNIDRYLALFAKDENLVMFGTGEKWVGYEDYKSAPQGDKEKFGDISISFDWLSINSHGPIGWVAAEVSVSLSPGDQRITVPARLTGVVKKSGDKWQIVQGHISSATLG